MSKILSSYQDLLGFINAEFYYSKVNYLLTNHYFTRKYICNTVANHKMNPKAGA